MISFREYILENSVLNVERARQAGNLTKEKNSRVSKSSNSLPSRQDTSLSTKLTKRANDTDTEDIMNEILELDRKLDGVLKELQENE